MNERRQVKLRPGKGRRLAEGAPWAFADEIAMDRRTRGLAPGEIVTLTSGDQTIGTVAFNGESQIAARLLDRDPEARIDQGWFEARLTAALAMRDRLYDAPFYRLVHAEGDGLPGVVIDRFGDALVIQPNAAWADRLLDELVAAACDVTGCTTVVVNAQSRVRKLEGLEIGLETVRGQADAPIEVAMNGATYLADMTGGQKTGLFFDQRENHAFVQRFAKDARVLDVFCHVGGFGLAALAAGASHVTAVDSSAPALALAEAGAERMDRSADFAIMKADAFAALGALDGQKFDIVICDPPAFAPNKGALKAGLHAYERVARLAAGLVGPGGLLVLCSCSHAASPEAFHRASTNGIRRAGRGGALIYSGRAGPDHPVHTGLPETSYLKATAYRLDSEPAG